MNCNICNTEEDLIYTLLNNTYVCHECLTTVFIYFCEFCNSIKPEIDKNYGIPTCTKCKSWLTIVQKKYEEEVLGSDQIV